jgi:hypothetical protein
MQVIIDPVGVNLSGQFVEMKSKFGQVTAIVADCTLAFTRHGNFLLKLGQ